MSDWIPRPPSAQSCSRVGNVTSADLARRFEAVYVNLQTPDFRIEGAREQAEFGGGARWSRDSALTRRKRGFNHFLFLLHKGAVQRTSPFWACWQFPPSPSFLYSEGFPLAQDHGTLDHILYLTNVAQSEELRLGNEGRSRCSPCH